MNFCRVVDIGVLLDIRRVLTTLKLCRGSNGSFSLSVTTAVVVVAVDDYICDCGCCC